MTLCVLLDGVRDRKFIGELERATRIELAFSAWEADAKSKA